MSDERIPPWAADLARDVSRLEVRVDDHARRLDRVEDAAVVRDRADTDARVAAASMSTRQGVLWQAAAVVVGIVATALLTLAIARLASGPSSHPEPAPSKAPREAPP